MASPKRQTVASSQPVAGGPVSAAPEPQDGPEYPKTENLGLTLPPDNANQWGDDFRRTMQTLDENPGVRAFAEGDRPGQPFDGQVILEQGATPALLAYSEATESWEPTSAPAPAPGYRHVQSMPSVVWTCIHNLGFIPAGIRAREEYSPGQFREVDGEVIANTTQATAMSFNEPIIGDLTVS